MDAAPPETNLRIRLLCLPGVIMVTLVNWVILITCRKGVKTLSKNYFAYLSFFGYFGYRSGVRLLGGWSKPHQIPA